LAERAAAPADPVAGLIDIPLPPMVSLWPQTWSLRIAIAVVVAALIGGLCWFIHRRRVNRYRRQALAELDRIARASVSPGQRAASLALLVRRTALAVFPREQVASLTGEAWLAFLDRTCGSTEFSNGAGRGLEAAAYQPARRDEKASALIDLVRRWIKAHHA
jgi:uncharacterized protein DUF4381